MRLTEEEIKARKSGAYVTSKGRTGFRSELKRKPLLKKKVKK